jgi:hypothetical protein
MHRIAVALTVVVALLFVPGCKKTDQPADSTTMGNATDRSTNGTSGTGEPVPPSTGSAAAAQQLGTVAPGTSTAVAITGTEDVHAAKTETTSTITGPGGTSTIAVATPTDTTSTVTKKKH